TTASSRPSAARRCSPASSASACCCLHWVPCGTARGGSMVIEAASRPIYIPVYILGGTRHERQAEPSRNQDGQAVQERPKSGRAPSRRISLRGYRSEHPPRPGHRRSHPLAQAAEEGKLECVPGRSEERRVGDER